MALQRFLDSPLPKAPIVGFFSPNFVLRQLFYRKIRQDLKSSHGELTVHMVDRDKAPFSAIQGALLQRGLFQQLDAHAVFLQKDDCKGNSGKAFFDFLTECKGHKSEAPLFIVGDFSPTQAQKKKMPVEMIWISEPRLDQAAEVITLFKAIWDLYPALAETSPDAFIFYIKAFEGDVTRATYACLYAWASDGQGKDSTTRAYLPQDIFALAKRMNQGRDNPEKLFQMAQNVLKHDSDWYPLLGLLHKFALDQPRAHKGKVFDRVATVDHFLKHFYPSSKQRELWAFLLIYLGRELQCP